MDMSIELSSVTFKRDGYPVLNELSLTVGKGELVVLTGASGAGKTTLLRLILMELLPDAGTVRVGEFSFPGLLPNRIPELRRNIGMVYQDFRLLEDRTVFENLSLVLSATGPASHKAAKKKILSALGDVALAQKHLAHPRELSGGEKQRAAIARAMLNDPFLLLADEPTGNLDEQAEAQVVEKINTIHRRGTTVLVATHSNALASRFEGRIVRLEGGLIIPVTPTSSGEHT